MASQESGVRVAANQPPPLVGHDVVTSDAALVEAVTRHASAASPVTRWRMHEPTVATTTCHRASR